MVVAPTSQLHASRRLYRYTPSHVIVMPLLSRLLRSSSDEFHWRLNKRESPGPIPTSLRASFFSSSSTPHLLFVTSEHGEHEQVGGSVSLPAVGNRTLPLGFSLGAPFRTHSVLLPFRPLTFLSASSAVATHSQQPCLGVWRLTTSHPNLHQFSPPEVCPSELSVPPQRSPARQIRSTTVCSVARSPAATQTQLFQDRKLAMTPSSSSSSVYYYYNKRPPHVSSRSNNAGSADYATQQRSASAAATHPSSSAFVAPSPPSPLITNSRADWKFTPSVLRELTRFDLVHYILDRKELIEAALERVTPREADHPRASILNEAIRYSLLAPAKRVRPLMCLTACSMLGGSERSCLGAAVAIEMIHTMSIIHDDLPVFDNDSLRRGVPANHIVFGDNIAILAGDSLLAGAFEQLVLLSGEDVPTARVLKVVKRLSNAFGLHGMAGGQTMDLKCEGRPDVTVEDLRFIHKRKTGALLKAAVASGAILAGATSDDVERLERYAENVGLAYQVADDILDVTQSTADLGKTAGKDTDSSKTTYPKLLGLEESKAIANKLISDAIEALEPYKERAVPLIAIAKYIVERTK